jgi:hypothetical protein
VISILRHKVTSSIVLFLSVAFAAVDGHTQGLATTVTPNPAASGVPLTISETYCGGPKTLQISFYYGTSNQNPLKTLIGTVNKPAGGYASIQWTPPAPGTYYLEAVSSNSTYCPATSGILTQVVGDAPQFFGFYDSNASSLDNPSFPDETAATSTFANTVWIACYSPAACSTALQEAQQDNMHAIVAFFNDPGLLAPGYTAAQLQSWESSWTTNWKTYTSVFSPYVNNGTIAAFYPYDEPFTYKPSSLNEWTSGNQAAETTAELNYAASVIHGKIAGVDGFSGSKVATTLTSAETFTFFTHNQNIIPSNVDWIGIDIYGCWSSCSDSSGSLTEPYSWYVSTLEAQLSSTQRVILLPGTAIYYGLGTYQYWQANVPASEWQPEVSSNAAIVQDILNLGITDTHIIGEFGFVYQTLYGAADVWIGADDPSMTTMLNVLTKFGKDIMNR